MDLLINRGSKRASYGYAGTFEGRKAHETDKFDDT